MLYGDPVLKGRKDRDCQKFLKKEVKVKMTVGAKVQQGLMCGFGCIFTSNAKLYLKKSILFPFHHCCAHKISPKVLHLLRATCVGRSLKGMLQWIDPLIDVDAWWFEKIPIRSLVAVGQLVKQVVQWPKGLWVQIPAPNVHMLKCPRARH